MASFLSLLLCKGSKKKALVLQQIFQQVFSSVWCQKHVVLVDSMLETKKKIDKVFEANLGALVQQ